MDGISRLISPDAVGMMSGLDCNAEMKWS